MSLILSSDPISHYPSKLWKERFALFLREHEPITGPCRGSSCQTDSLLGKWPFPKNASHNRDRSYQAHAKQRPSRSLPLISVETVGNQQAASGPKSDTSTSHQSDLRECQVSLFHTLCGCTLVAIVSS